MCRCEKRAPEENTRSLGGNDGEMEVYSIDVGIVCLEVAEELCGWMGAQDVAVRFNIV